MPEETRNLHNILSSPAQKLDGNPCQSVGPNMCIAGWGTQARGGTSKHHSTIRRHRAPPAPPPAPPAPPPVLSGHHPNTDMNQIHRIERTRRGAFEWQCMA
ncbi:hypothetical protein TWF694_001663 [Orbilia ellipsospora]|uniref:Peptidase S1 domain-containing protein n=1 Tax=Orbilia ellipsospora TaxID=2528407 RepID=A0AAV9X3G2_9PEZI